MTSIELFDLATSGLDYGITPEIDLIKDIDRLLLDIAEYRLIKDKGNL